MPFEELLPSPRLFAAKDLENAIHAARAGLETLSDLLCRVKNLSEDAEIDYESTIADIEFAVDRFQQASVSAEEAAIYLDDPSDDD